MRKSISTAAGLLLTASAAYANPMGSLPDGFIFDGDINLSYFATSGGDTEFYIVDLDIGYEFPVSGDFQIGVGLNTFGIGDFGSSSFIYNPFIYANFGNYRVSFGGVKSAVGYVFDDMAIFNAGYIRLISDAFVNFGASYPFNTSGEILRGDATFGATNLSVSYDFNTDFTAIAGRHTLNPNLDILAGVTLYAGGEFWVIGADYTSGDIELSALVQSFSGLTTLSIKGEYAFTDRLSVSASAVVPINGAGIEIYTLGGKYAFNDMFGISADWGTFNGSSAFSADINVSF